MIKTFQHKGLEQFFRTGKKAGIQPALAPKLALRLGRLDIAKVPQDVNVPGWKLHPLKGELDGFWSIWVTGNWRLIFAFDGEDVILVDLVDYH